GQYAGYIRARSLRNIGGWKTFSLAQIQKLSKAKVTKPQPQVSIPTTPNLPYTLSIPKNMGWALKENQKFGNKGGAKFPKKIITILQVFFHAGIVDKSDCYTAQDMYSELIKMAEDDEINQESIPRVESIQSWITCYAAASDTSAVVLALATGLLAFTALFLRIGILS
ncbi:12142_t:CDS:2, partial [Entrophospora sp. SA101]